MECPLLKKAVSSKDLTKRADSNRLYAKNDFNLWVKELLNDLHFSSVLDVCCGTGNQLVLYGARPEVVDIVGVDISRKALRVAKKRLEDTKTKAHIILKAIKMEDMFEKREIKKRRFDLISCFYGLYYSRDAKEVLKGMIDHLPDEGRILIVGPYGENNANLFSLLRRHFSLPTAVTRSCSTFMEDEVYPMLSKHCAVKSKTFVNQIYYPDLKSLVDYWQATTFYSGKHEEAVVRDIKDHFSVHKEFIVEKHVLAYIASPFKKDLLKPRCKDE